MKNDFFALYEALIDGVKCTEPVRNTLLGERWALVETETAAGMAMFTDGRSIEPMFPTMEGLPLCKAAEAVRSWNYEEICSRDYRVVLPYECYSYDSASGTYTELSLTDSGVRYLYKNALKLKVTGIIRANKDSVTTILNGSVGYTSSLT